MMKAYIIPQLSAIKIDSEISLRLTTVDNAIPTEPGSNPGGGGESNGGNNNDWNRGSIKNQDFSSGIWK
jgi:hypothetical protein